MSNKRTNNATEGTIDKSSIFARGTFKNVWQGRYTEGTRAGQKCVAKEFRTGSVFEAHYFEEELNVISRAQKIIDNWHSARIINQRIILNTPEIWTYTESGIKNLMEPMIENFEKFNSNTGWADITGGVSSEVMQALSHFSYDDSGGQFLLCDLQGGVYSDGYILSDPVIMSQRQNCGPADLGPDGIRSFFSKHQCNRFCKPYWTRPRLTGQPLYPMRQGTTMISRLPQRQSRNLLTQLQEE